MRKRSGRDMDIQELLRYLAIIRKRGWLILLLVISTVGGILVIARSHEPVYEASLKFLFTTPPTAEVSVYNEFRQTSLRDEIPFAKANFIEILTSGVVIYDAIETLGADITVDEVAAGLTVEPVPDSEFVELSLQCRDPQLVAIMTNTLMDVALEYYGELRARPTTMSRIFISEQLALSLEEWETAEEDFTQFQIAIKIGDLNAAISTRQELLQSLALSRDTAWAEDDFQAVEKYEAIIAGYERELESSLGLRSQYTALQATANQARGIYELLLDRQTQAKLKENEIRNVGFVSMLGPARKPSSPVPFGFKLMLVGALVALVVGVSLAFGWEYLETQDIFETERERAATDRHSTQNGLP
jgi:uncharacterized protein involved in exopolysaccharide biosynthesis